MEEEETNTDNTDGTDNTDNTDGTDGTDNTDGTDGTDNTDGTDGTDGTDEVEESEESEDEVPAYKWMPTVPNGCEINEDDFSVTCKEHCTIDEACEGDDCVADKCKSPE